MLVLHFIVFLFCVVSFSKGWSDTKQRKFPNGFMFGTASAAYQVEGAWDEDGKGESIWDRFLHTHPDIVTDGRNGDVGSDSYHNYKRDVEMVRELGVDFYRFSVAWPRILPSGFTNKINEEGLDYYDGLIDELLKYDIQPMLTLYHFDLPQPLQQLGGWVNPLVVDWFTDYARIVFDRYAHKVPYFITVNQPNTICIEGYGEGVMAPGVVESGIADYLCVKNVLLAHAAAYRLYDTEYRAKYKGSVGISIAVNWIDPVVNNTENYEATERARAFQFGLYLDPIWSPSGDYPSLVKDIVAAKSKQQGFTRSRLPALTDNEIKLIKGSSDFLGMNHYTSFHASPRPKGELTTPASFADDMGAVLTQGQQWKQAKSAWLRSAPYGLYKACLHLNLKYNYPTIIITEHGWSTVPALYDNSRVDNMKKYLSALLLALEDGTEVKGYTAWSLLDNIEWTAGTSERFGLYQVDFESANKTRTARLSALHYKHIIETRVAEDDWKPKDLNIQITKRKLKTEL